MDSCLQNALDAIRRATTGMTVEQMAWQPEGKWSAAEILEHLSLTFSGTAKGMQRVAETGLSGSTRATLKQRVSTFAVTGLGYFPTGRKSPAMVDPKSSDAATAVERIVRELINMDVVLSDVEKKIGARARVPHPILGPLTILQWRKFHRIHTRHHMKQIDALREKQRH